MEQVTGTVVVKVNGSSIRSKEGAKLSVGGFERTPIYADGQLIGYSQKPVAAMITCTLADTASADLIAIAAFVDESLAFETDTGKTYNVRGAFCTKPPELTGGEGDVSVEFAGAPAVQS